MNVTRHCVVKYFESYFLKTDLPCLLSLNTSILKYFNKHSSYVINYNKLSKFLCRCYGVQGGLDKLYSQV